MPSEEIEPAIPAIEGPQIHALDRTDKGNKEHNYRDKATNTGHTHVGKIPRITRKTWYPCLEKPMKISSDTHKKALFSF
jgi:hypothetical protein